MKTDLSLKFKQNLFSKVIWSSTFKLNTNFDHLSENKISLSEKDVSFVWK